MDYERRIGKVQALLADHEIDALLVTNLTNVSYLTGLSGTNGQMLLDSRGAQFFTDGRYAARAKDLVRGIERS